MNPHEVNAKLGEQAKWLYENTDFALIGSAVIGDGIFEQPALVPPENIVTMFDTALEYGKY